MASFKPDVGFGGGFNNFFVGVDQTFAGGDAAATMSKLYASPQAGPAEDSTLVLAIAPKYKNVFQRLAKPGEVKPFIFGTDTMLGLKVAWSGVGGQMPDSVKAGFNRKEFAWAPVTMSNVTVNGKETHHVRMPSFLATIDSQQEVLGTNKTGISALQYFATGKAATALAVQPDVRAAMLARLDPNKEQYRKKFGAALDSAGKRAAFSFLTTVYEDLASRTNANAQANALVTQLDEFATALVPTTYPLTVYSLVGTNLQAQQGKKRGDRVLGDPPFRRLLSYWGVLSSTRKNLEKAQKVPGVTMDGQAIALDQLSREITEATKLLNGLEEAIGQRPTVTEAIDLYITLIKE